MNSKQVYALKIKDKVNHKHYGRCTVTNVIPDFGVCIVPDYKGGRDLLTLHSQMPQGTPLLETKFRLLSKL